MVRNMTPEEWELLYGSPKTQEVSGNGSNGKVHDAALDALGVDKNKIAEISASLTEANENAPLTDEELELIAEQTVAGYNKKFVKEDWQTVDILHLLRHHDKAHEEGKAAGSANWSEMGCVFGGEVIRVLTPSGKVKDWTIAEAYLGFNKIHPNARKNWKSSGYKTLAWVDGRIRHNDILGITYSGEKYCIKITTNTDENITLTPDHEVMLYGGKWIEAGNLAVGDWITVKGGKGQVHNSKRIGQGKRLYLKTPEYGGTRVEMHGEKNVYFATKEARLLAGAKPNEHVHHIIDGDNTNDDPSNLQVLTLEEHSRAHARDQIASYDAPPACITSIEEVGVVPTFDLSMAEPHNFVASNVVVHNCFKTSTGLWLTEKLTSEAQKRQLLDGPKLAHKHPSILIITSKGGKGTYLEAVPEILPGFQIFNIETQAMYWYKNGQMLKLDKSHKFVEKEYDFPVVCIAHYNIFARTNFGKFEIDPTTNQPLQLDGKFMFKPWNQADYIINREWDVVLCDEFHKIKDRNAKQTVNIKKIKASVGKHGMTGTGFINRPDEIWSLLNWLDPENYGSYWQFREAFCNTLDAPVWMSDLSFKPLGEIEIGDRVVGWEKIDSPGRWGTSAEKKLVESEVLAIKKSVRPVVKVTMKSGRVIKCTPDHQWLSGKWKATSEDKYVNVLNIGERARTENPVLVRVIDPTPPLVEPEKQYAAAYLGAMMDAEGTWPIIAQSPIKNPDVHKRIGETLDTLGFNWNHEYKGSDGHKFRINGLNGQSNHGGERNFAHRQRTVDFLNWCKPAKKDRIVNSILGKGRWKFTDEIASVELIGEYEVACMQTTTGNYIIWGYASKNCEIDDWDGNAKVAGCKPEMRDAFRTLVRDIGVRRTLDQVMPNIKSPIFKPITVELNATQRKMYDQIKMELAAEDQKGTPLYAANVLSMLQRLRQICVGTPEVIEDYYDEVLDRRVQKIKLVEPSSKIDALMEILEELQWDDERKEPLVVFSNFKDPLEIFKARLDKHNQACIDMGLDFDQFGYKYIHLDVGDNDVERYRKWHDEFPKLEHRIFMSTLQLGGESINLTPARHVVFLDRSWSPKDNAQGIGRIRRPGQTEQPVVIHINANHTTDQYIERVNDIKQGWFNNIFGKDEL